MPTYSEPISPATHDPSQPDIQQQQIKLCFACHSPLSPDSINTPLIHHDSAESSDTTIVCTQCRIRLLALRPASVPRDSVYVELERDLRRAVSQQDGCNEAIPVQQDSTSRATHATTHQFPDNVMQLEPSALPTPSSLSSSTAPCTATHEASSHSPSARPSLVPINTSDIIVPQVCNIQYEVAPPSTAASSSSKVRPRGPAASPDPLVDITRLRVRSQGHHCLYPGAIFQGTQKSGRNSYDVTVTIVDVDFSSSHLCGYLRIRGLTDDWPELTTYFDAEIIGSRYGFLTRNWGASEQEDMVHWARFPAFRHVRHELMKPHLTMKDANRGAVFMRWKEKFLVPDHRVQDINGASFAGFYYVCVDFNPQQSGPAGSQSPQAAQPHPLSGENAGEALSALEETPSRKPESTPRVRRMSSSHGSRRIGRSPSRGFPSNVATMSGFYFHQNSEPYQQLSLVHVPERTTSCFEFR
ncbi:hypothetical protein SCP_0406370 [Sparassis crispa]|uniref:Vacuolar import and degradation protein n=1 Tax=Sparassis crispa TaxID=139825 RepID=A0A401GJB2_9APHY|nr:hypothetical protein SCP_0406370 [Sparassis crispa]GBE82253.1 hypothetical protein SCP_0406370 [Sparassis crispa]